MKNNFIPYGIQNITEEDVNAIVETLKSNFLTQGPVVTEFELQFAKYIGSKYAVAVSSGTAALHLCALALNVKENQKVITTPITFAASANCIKYCGGDVVFSDIDPNTFLLDISKVKLLLESSPKGTYKGIIPVDFAGRAVDLEKLRDLADQFGLWIIEDACHAPGGYFIDTKNQKQNCGNSKFADLAIFSFHPVKHIACGEGGMITTNNKELYTKLLKLRTHGITKTNDEFVNDIKWAQGGENTDIVDHKYPGWYMEMQQLGYNYRLTDFQAALGISQLKRADIGIERRTKIAEKYNNEFRNCSFIKSQSGLVKGHAYHLYVIEVNHRLELYNFLKANNIFAQIHYIPTHLMPYYKQFGWKVGDMPNAENYYEGCISLPIYPTLSDSEQDFVINKIKEFYNE
jgi:UDP-4-amino-4,6-dideoxy-N-acetyl-beta-L-altrosamine transaminase